MIRSILRWPDKRLTQVADPVGEVDDEVRAILDDMVETMDAMPGYGLAAPQIGVMRRLAVVDGSEERGQAVRLINPEIVLRSDMTRPHEEASPCLPGVSAKLERAARITVRFLDTGGAEVEREFGDIWATSVQHQIDHLDGKLFVDRLSPTRRKMLLKKAEKLAKRD